MAEEFDGGALIGRRIQNLRKGQGKTQMRLAEEAEISTHYLAEIERGTKLPRLEVFIRLVNALGVSADELLQDYISRGAAVKAEKLEKYMVSLTPQQQEIACAVLESVTRIVKERKSPG